MKIFITGTAGFIGFHLARRLLADGHQVTGFDGVTDYYDIRLKRARLAQLAGEPNFTAVEAMLEDAEALTAALAASEAEIVVHLAAQAGVRYSIEQPQSYVQSNLVGTANLLEAVRAYPPRHVLFASSSSVYGGNSKTPFSENDRLVGPVSFYAATKTAGEAMVHSYSHLWKLPVSVLRFFTVYGPWGRPDMALFKFVAAAERGEAIEIYGEGRMQRDFTYVDDLIEAVLGLMERPPVRGQMVAHDSLSPMAPYRVVNMGGGQPRELMVFIDAIEAAVGRPIRREMLPMQAGDVVSTEADTRLLQALVGKLPSTPIETGVAEFVAWYRVFYRE
jgi:UDP-glucuronate 4-epimerase